MRIAMSTIANPQKRPRIASGAVLVPTTRFQEWHDRAVLMPGLNDVERGVLGAIAESYRQLEQRGYEMVLSRDRLAHRLDVGPVRVRWAIDRLLELGLLAIQSGAGGRANVYLPALPRKIAASMAAADAAAPA
jgi:hypothetical protein